MTDKKQNNDAHHKPDTSDANRDRRRKLLAGGGTVLGAAAFPKEWTRPVFETVILPAHAQTSGSVLGDQLPLTQVTDAGGWLDYLIPTAHAQTGTGDLLGGCIILAFNGDTVEATLLLSGGGELSNTGTHNPDTGVFAVTGIGGEYNVNGTSAGGPGPASASGTVQGSGGGSLNFNATTGGASCTPLASTTTAAPTTTASPTSTPLPTSTF